ncbi:Bicyclomycin resistance protein [Alphaproteobacteria bacterium SO-S41]|nr:Bicyclomycin resistance protein [Alphaproteobacteria bacterium SO-S41]
MSASPTSARVPHPGMGFRQFVALIALLMAVNALSIDAMLPALPAIGHALGVVTENERQWVVTAYLLGFGVSQLIYGPLSDRYGRKPVLLWGLGIFVVFSVAAAFATTFPMLLLARVLQGVGTAATRVLAVSIVRDSYSGRRMARVMSLAFIVFLTIPIFAPSIGQLVLLFAPWPWIFGVLAIFGGVVAFWAFLKLPETLHTEDRRPISVASIAAAVRFTLTQRISVGYMLAQAVIMGGLFGFVTSAQQVFVDVFDEETLFPALFASIAVFMGLSSFLNASIVERLGTRFVSHSAILAYIGFAVVHAIVAWTGYETIWSFIALQGAMMFCFGLVGSNFGSMAMEPLGHIAGTASSVQGFITTVTGALLGFAIGQNFDGTVIPLTFGFALCGLAAFVIVLVTERGRLFRPTQTRLG